MPPFHPWYGPGSKNTIRLVAIQEAVEAILASVARETTLESAVALLGDARVRLDALIAATDGLEAAAAAANASLDAIEASTDGVEGALASLNATGAGLAVALGGKADAPAGDDAGTWSLIALIKRLLAKFVYEDAVHASGDPGVQMLTVRRDAPIAGGANGDYQPAITDPVSRLYTRAVKDPTSSGHGRTKIHVQFQGLTATATIHTVTPGKLFYMQGYRISIINDDLTSDATIAFSDNGSDKIPFIVPDVQGATTSPQLNESLAMDDGPIFSTNMQVRFVAGANRVASGAAWGYEE